MRLLHVAAFASILLLVFYALIDSSIVLFFVLHLIELALFILLLWRVETLPQLSDNGPSPVPVPEPDPEPATPARSLSSGNEAFATIEHLLAERCVDTGLYLQHDLTLEQLAKTLGTNRTYLGQYFSGKGTTYNAYINDLRIGHFVALHHKAVAAGRTVTAQQLAQESGFRSYSTFSTAFKQRMGLSVTAWMRETTK
ncbi:MAG: helix-turn-helix transcriptional regulator [Bacteroidales bacterium]|nr:helix-turn-helix transcriptional regulator [Bacteroidales bacterium]